MVGRMELKEWVEGTTERALRWADERGYEVHYPGTIDRIEVLSKTFRRPRKTTQALFHRELLIKPSWRELPRRPNDDKSVSIPSPLARHASQRYATLRAGVTTYRIGGSYRHSYSVVIGREWDIPVPVLGVKGLIPVYSTASIPVSLWICSAFIQYGLAHNIPVQDRIRFLTEEE